jgi:two-component system cell cycle response regulator DivK
MAERILVIEDDQVSRELASEVLLANGFEVIGVRTGEEGLDCLTAPFPDLIVLDIQLPGISGLEIARRVRGDAATAHIPMVAVTAEAMPGDEEKILAAGCTAYLAKPLRFSTLVDTIRRLLDRARLS